MDPDGYIIVNVREVQLTPLGDAYQEMCQTYKYDFKNLRFWKKESWGIQIANQDGSVTGYPWPMIEQFFCRPNSAEYVKWIQEKDD